MNPDPSFHVPRSSFLAPFYYHPRMLAYDFGPQHPLRPERLLRTIETLESSGFEPKDPGEGNVEDVLRVHSEEYVHAIQGAEHLSGAERAQFGVSSGDTPVFEGMYEASLAYTSGSAQAALDVAGGAPLAISLSGGLHHAQKGHASGFCVFNDCAVAISILKERFERVAYVDIDVHHGDGVQALFYDDPNVLTCSIHQDGRTLYPGTGFVEETGVEFSSLNVPLMPGTTGDVWVWAFSQTILPAIDRFKPQAVVLQMGTDSHFLDPLARINNTCQEWLQAVTAIRDLRLPTVALGGGGYNVDCVIRMWSSACLTLVAEEVLEQFLDAGLPIPRESGRDHAEAVVDWLTENFLDRMSRL